MVEKTLQYSLVEDVNGEAIHASPPMGPWCPAVYQGEDGSIVFVGKTLDPGTIKGSGLVVNKDESVMEVPVDHLKRLFEVYAAGNLPL